MEGWKSGVVSNVGFRLGLSIVTYLVIDGSDSDFLHEIGYDLVILIVSHVIHVPDSTDYTLEFVFDPFQGTRESLKWDGTKSDQIADMAKVSPRVGSI